MARAQTAGLGAGARRRRAGGRRAGGQPGQQPGLAAGPGAQVQPRARRAVRGRRVPGLARRQRPPPRPPGPARARRAGWPRPARPRGPARPPGLRPGSPSGRYAPNGDQRAACAPPATSSAGPAEAGHGAEGDRGRSPSAASAASVSARPPAGSSPRASPSAATIQRGWLYRTARWPTRSASRPGAAISSQASRSRVATRRSTALTNPAGRGPATSLARSTEVATAACAPTLVASS